MNPAKTVQRRGIVEGFFGPLWSMAHRRRLFEFGAARGMNTYLYVSNPVSGFAYLILSSAPPARPDTQRTLLSVSPRIVTQATFFASGRTVSCLPIAWSTARKLFNSGLPFDDSVRYGVFGFNLALRASFCTPPKASDIRRNASINLRGHPFSCPGRAKSNVWNIEHETPMRVFRKRNLFAAGKRN